MTSGRRPTPVPVIYFPAKKSLSTSPTQLIPAVEEVVTEIDRPLDEVETVSMVDKRPTPPPMLQVQPPEPEKRRKRPRQKKSELERGFADLAALGHELFTQGRVLEARAVYEGLVVSRPDDGFAHTMLGTILLALDKVDRAYELFDRALALDGADLAALVYRGEIRLTRKKTRLAAEDFEAAIALGAADDAFTLRAQRLLKMAKRRR